MTKELIERLRYISSHAGSGSATNTVCEAAINAIESLQAENERLKEEAKQWQSLSELSLGMAEAHSKERDALAAKLVPLEADAERYRLLRERIYIDEERRLRIARVYLFLLKGKRFKKGLTPPSTQPRDASMKMPEPFTHYRHYDEQLQPFADENTVPLYDKQALIDLLEEAAYIAEGYPRFGDSAAEEIRKLKETL